MGADCQCLQSIDSQNMNTQNDFKTPVTYNTELPKQAPSHDQFQTQNEPITSRAVPFSQTPKEDPSQHIDNEETKLLGNLQSMGDFITEIEFEQSIPYDYMRKSQEDPYNAQLSKEEQTNKFQMQPIKLKNGNYYWGSWNTDSQMHGEGKWILSEESAFWEGVWLSGILLRGRLYFVDTIYIGTFKNSEYHGKGKLVDRKDKYIYEGDFVNGFKDGHGTLVFEDGSKYKGEFKEDDMTGQGELSWSNGYYYRGQFSLGAILGCGYLVSPNKSSFEGNIVSDNFNGENCVYKWSSGEKYEGDYNHGIKEGKGKYSFNDCSYQGQWYAGKPHGKGFFETPDRVVHGFWRGGEMIEKTSETFKTEGERTNYSMNLEPLEEEININMLMYISHEEDPDIRDSAHYAQDSTAVHDINLDDIDN